MMDDLDLKERAAQAPPAFEWGNPVPVKPTLPAVPPFKLEFLPIQLQGWAEDVGERMDVPLDFVGIPAIVQAGGLLGRRISIRPQMKTDWAEACNLWGAIIAKPGAMKSPCLQEVLKPLRKMEAEARKANDAAKNNFAAMEMAAKVAGEVARDEAKKRVKAGDNEGAAAAFASALAPTRPPELRYEVQNFTVEKLGEICADNPMGVIAVRDEIISLFTDLEKPEKAAERGFMLSGWGGDQPYTFDRIMRGTVHIPAVNISLIGTTQPQKIAQLISNSIRSQDDGMVQRLQLLAWPDFNGEWRDCDRYPNAAAKEAAFACYNDLARLDVHEVGGERGQFDSDDSVPFLRFDYEAYQAFKSWRGSWLEPMLRDDDTAPALQSHFNKFRGLIPRLAIIHHLASGKFGPVALPSIETAIALADYLAAHARRVYGCGSAQSTAAAQAILRKIRGGDLQDCFTARDVKRHQWAGLSDGAVVEQGLEMLVDNNWLRPVPVPTGGRPSEQFLINPAAHNA